jgi:Zn finger protein HypA/HybF involved in hydrogenase expression
MPKEIKYENNMVGNFRLYGFATGSYHNECSSCGKQFIGDKHSVQCLECAIKHAEICNDSCILMQANISMSNSPTATIHALGWSVLNEK